MSEVLALPVGEVLPRFEAGACSARARRPETTPAGSGRLAIAFVEGSSAVVGCTAAPPLHVFTPRPRGRSVSILLSTYGGGLLAGDVVDLAVDLGDGTTAVVGTQAETKVYRSDGPWAEQRLLARIGEGAALAVVPEPTSCFAGARYRQHQRFELHPRGSLLLLDAVTPGRSARGERWAFEAYLSRNDVHVGGRPVLRDALRLARGEGPAVARRMGSFELLATWIAVGPALAEAATRVLQEVGGRSADGGADVLVAASPLLDGAYVRVAARTVEAGLAFVRAQVALASSVFGRDALQRRT